VLNASQGLSTAVIEDAALAAAAREGGVVLVAEIPTAALKLLQGTGLAVEKTTELAGTTGTEIRFAPQAVQYILHLFKPVGG
jgi:hypothetical protein